MISAQDLTQAQIFEHLVSIETILLDIFQGKGEDDGKVTLPLNFQFAYPAQAGYSLRSLEVDALSVYFNHSVFSSSICNLLIGHRHTSISLQT